jgi:DNA (cytosine-5)-methyltransferase 1
MDYKIKLATVFSGIGAVEQALHKMNIPVEIVFACDNGERYLELGENEIPIIKAHLESLPPEEQNAYVSNLYSTTKKRNHVKDTYFMNYELNNSKWFEDIRFVDGKKFTNQIDLFVGGSPCQSFSIIGKRGGLDDPRGFLFFDFARLVDEIKPKVFIYENVLGMLSIDKGKTWKKIEQTFIDLGYKIYGPMILNSLNYGIPQDRKRLFVVGFLNHEVEFSHPITKEIKPNLIDFLEKGNVKSQHYLGKKGFEFVTNSKYKNRARVANDYIKTQKANQQFNWNGDFIFEEFDRDVHNDEIINRAHLGEFNGKKGYIRQLTHRECARLMGFSEQFIYSKHNIAAYRQLGNSIVVNVLESLIEQIINSGVFQWEK